MLYTWWGMEKIETSSWKYFLPIFVVHALAVKSYKIDFIWEQNLEC